MEITHMNVTSIHGRLDRIETALRELRLATLDDTGGPLGTGASISVDGAGMVTGHGGMTIIYRGDANCPDGRSATANRKQFDSIILHHNAAHLTTDWLIRYQIDGDTARGGHFGYHFYIDPNGSIYQGAPMGKRTNHVKPLSRLERKPFGRVATNNSAIGVTCVKAGPIYTPTAQQIAAQETLVRALAAAYGIPFSNVFGHGEIQSDRDHREGTSEASKIRGGTSGRALATFGPVDDDMDDSALEGATDSPSELLGGDAWDHAPAMAMAEDEDDETPGVTLEAGNLVARSAGLAIGTATSNTRLNYTNGGAIRNKSCTPNLETRLVQAVEATYGPGCSINIYSGGQDRKGFGARRTGSIRHDDYGQGGRAADIHVFDSSGRQIQGLELAKLGQYWLATNFGCVGHEMGGGGIHLDEWVPPPSGGGRYWTYAASDAQPWGSQARAILARGAAGTYS